MLPSIRRSLLRLRAAPSITGSIAPSTLTLLHHAPTTSTQSARAFAISAILSSKRNLPSIIDLSEHSAILEDAEHEVEATEDDFIRFQDLADRGVIDGRVIRNITEGMKFDEMTKVQRKTVLSTVKGDDVLAQARTGTGKTIAFLLPAIQRLITSPDPIKQRAIDIRTIIISPTRELAIQIFDDATKLTRGTGIVCQSAVGGTGKSRAVEQMRRQGCHILIATPGRLADLLQDSYAGVNVSKVDTLVLDEGDTLLDQGFSEAIDDIIKQLPSSNSEVRQSTGRQSMVFSATMPQKVLEMVRKTLNKDYKFLKMVDKGEATVHTHVRQHLITCRGFENILPSVYELVMRELPGGKKPVVTEVDAAKEAIEGQEEAMESVLDEVEHTLEDQVKSNEPFKAIIFFPTTKFAALACATFRNLEHADGDHPIYKHVRMIEIHSRLTQAARTRAAERFRNAKSAILFASDVVARGMDFPNVTHVIQVCAPSNQEQYIHRLGRTGRANKSGVGYLMLTEQELQEHGVRSVFKGMNMQTDTGIESSSIDLSVEQQLGKSAVEAITSITQSSMKQDIKEKSDTYISLMGYFNGVFKNRQALVDALNRWTSVGWGMRTPPGVSRRIIEQMGMSRLSGLNERVIVREPSQDRAPREPRDGEERAPRDPSKWVDRRSSSEGRSFGDGAEGGERRSFGDGAGGGERRSFGDGAGGGERRSFGDRGDRPSRGSYGGGRGGGSFGGRSSFGDRGRSSFGDRPPRPYGDRAEGGERRSFGDRGDRPSRGSYGGGRGGSSFGDRGGSSFGDRGGSSYGDRPSRGSYGGGRGGSSFGGGRGGSSFGGGRGGSSFGDRSSRGSYGDRSSRGSYSGGRGGSSFGDRPPRTYQAREE